MYLYFLCWVARLNPVLSPVVSVQRECVAVFGGRRGAGSGADGRLWFFWVDTGACVCKCVHTCQRACALLHWPIFLRLDWVGGFSGCRCVVMRAPGWVVPAAGTFIRSAHNPSSSSPPRPPSSSHLSLHHPGAHVRTHPSRLIKVLSDIQCCTPLPFMHACLHMPLFACFHSRACILFCSGRCERALKSGADICTL